MTVADRQAIQARVARAIGRAVEMVNRGRPAARRLGTDPETVLLGAGASLDSLGVVNFIVAVEEEVAEEFGRTVNLADERMRGQVPNPLRTLSALEDYLVSLVGAA